MGGCEGWAGGLDFTIDISCLRLQTCNVRHETFGRATACILIHTQRRKPTIALPESMPPRVAVVR